MKVTSAKIVAKRYTGLDIRVNNGTRDFTVNIDKKKLTYDEFKNMEMDVRVYTLIKNCCTAKPMSLYETGKSENDTNEIKEIIECIDNLIGDELKEILG